MTKEEREQREYKSLFTDERYAKKAWKEIMGKALNADACKLPPIEDGKGNQTAQSIIYNEAYKNIKARLEAQGFTREPTQAELIVEANLIRAAMDNGVFNTILDRTAGKVKEELNLSTSAYADLTDEQLEVLAAYEESKKARGETDGTNDTD